ncbi:hypothetical protein Tco_0730612 [Tanacetum coccineum]|uniref:DUF659 domain-containing protein n=1 Tax=Tanacetum coccineum TaxID=301880 RepID=A0ABQ4YUS0_9ASTR
MLENMNDEVGEENVIQIVTDNASNYAHCIDLVLEDIGNLERVKSCLKKAMFMNDMLIGSGFKNSRFYYGRVRFIPKRIEDVWRSHDNTTHEYKSYSRMAVDDIAYEASEQAYPTRASTSRDSVQGSSSAPKGKGVSHAFTSSLKAYPWLIDEDYEDDIGLSKDDEVNEELKIDVDDDEDDEIDLWFGL